MPTSRSSSTVSYKSRVNNEQKYYHSYHNLSPTTIISTPILKKPSKVSEFSITLEPSTEINLSSTRIESTETLTVTSSNNDNNHNRTKQRPATIKLVMKTTNIRNTEINKNLSENQSQIRGFKTTHSKIKESASEMMESIGTVVHEFVQNSTNEKLEVKPEEVIHFHI